MSSASPISERDWEAEEDARSLIRVAEIRQSKKRLARAKKALTKLSEEKQKEALAAKLAKKFEVIKNANV